MYENIKVDETEYFRKLNFHPTQLMDNIRAWMKDPTGRPMVLLGRCGSGRNYCLQAASYRQKMNDKPFEVITIDWEKQGGGSGITLGKWLSEQPEVQGNKHNDWITLFAQFFNLEKQSTPSGAGPITFVLKVAESLKLARALLETSFIPGKTLPETSPYSLIRRLLEKTLVDRNLIINIRNGDLLDRASAEEWLDIRRSLDRQSLKGVRHGRLLLALSCFNQAQPIELLGLGREEICRLSMLELTEKEMWRILNRNFPPNNFDDDLVKNLLLFGSIREIKTTGFSSIVAGAVGDMVKNLLFFGRVSETKNTCFPSLVAGAVGELLLKKLIIWEDEQWIINPYRTSDEIATILEKPLWRHYQKQLSSIDETVRSGVEQFMFLAALCGQWIPKSLLLDYMGLTDEEERDSILDSLEKAFVGIEPSLLTDGEFNQSGFPSIAIYRFSVPLLAVSLLPTSNLENEAGILLRFLEKRLPLHSRAVAGLFWHLAQLSGATICKEWQQRLGWYFEPIMAKRFEDRLLRDLESGRLTTERVLKWANREYSRQRESIYLFQAVTSTCDCYYQSRDGVPESMEGEMFFGLYANTLDALGDHDNALDKREKILIIRQGRLPMDHPGIAQSLNDIGYTLDMLGRTEEALDKMKEALEIRQEALPRDHPDIATSFNNVGHTLGRLRHHEEALGYMETALEMRQRILPEDHPLVPQSLTNLGVALSNLNHHEEALVKHEEALEACQRFLPKEHSDAALILFNYGTTLCDLERYEEALEKHEAALKMLQRLLPMDHPNIVRSLNKVGYTLDKLGRTEEALEKIKGALEIRQRILPPDHSDISKSYRWLKKLEKVIFDKTASGNQL